MKKRAKERRRERKRERERKIQAVEEYNMTINMYVAKIGLKLLSRAVKYSALELKGRDVNLPFNIRCCRRCHCRRCRRCRRCRCSHQKCQIPDYNFRVKAEQQQ